MSRARSSTAGSNLLREKSFATETLSRSRRSIQSVDHPNLTTTRLQTSVSKGKKTAQRAPIHGGRPQRGKIVTVSLAVAPRYPSLLTILLVSSLRCL